MKKNYYVILVIAIMIVGCILLTSCGLYEEATNYNVNPKNPSEQDPSSEDPPKPVTYEEITSVDSVPSGEYIKGGDIITIDKENKTIKCVSYNGNYSKYLNKDGETKFDTAITFVKYGEYDSIRFQNNGKDNFIYNSNGYIITTKSETSTSTTNLNVMPTSFVTPETGLYVSEEQEQYKVNENGERIPNENGGYEKEKFYLFLDFTETEAKIYVGTSAESHEETPLYMVSNYEYSFNSVGLSIKIPHTEDSYHCSVTFKNTNEVSFVNYSSDVKKYHDYSCSGKLIKVENE
ncbi:MAG: hypothetical protein K5765_02970 [Clostridia bacterium]|nr:hypothetical protein [Clostridia bacterium]